MAFVIVLSYARAQHLCLETEGSMFDFLQGVAEKPLSIRFDTVLDGESLRDLAPAHFRTGVRGELL